LNKTNTKIKLFAICKIASLGGAIFVMLTIGAITHYFSLDMSILIASPVFIATQLLGLNKESTGKLMNSDLFAIIVNGFLGVVVFGIIASFWQFLLKGDNEK
jgi:hypothetical protein